MRSDNQINRAFAVVAEWVTLSANDSDIHYNEDSGVVTGVQMPARVVAATAYIRSCGIGSDEYKRRLKKAMLTDLHSKVMPAPMGVQ